MQTPFQVTDQLLDTLYNCTVLPEDQIKALCEEAKTIFKAEPNVVHRKSPITIPGDCLAHLTDFVQVFELAGKLPDTHFLLMGNYVDRGQYSVESITLFLALKVKYPQLITMLRGNHEAKEISKVYGLYDNVMKHYGNESVWEALLEVFNTLPLAAVIDDKYFCVHGGPAKDITSINEIQKLDRFAEVQAETPICDLLWSDPSDENGFTVSARGAGHHFGADVTAKFLAENNLQKIIRGHQMQQNGYSLTHNDQVATVWGAPNYCSKCGNTAAFLQIDDSKEEKLKFTTYSAKEAKKSE